ncbi:hypothetical protein OG552_04550 [Streptomyces sp. NBC_01476]|uniref:hypothetical protein n=1 Tax=Streptomyces sp. NBC_01476 TaxID=2903881 RepID=UPI002E2FBC5D|nr:hypothetical protein [Streptomyces sp. NBC_01476]
MTIAEPSTPAAAGRAGPAAALRGFLAALATGAALAAVVVGIVIGNAALGCAGAGLLVATVVVAAVTGHRRRQGRPVPVRVTALAMIESRRAMDGESADVPIRFVLTVAPDDRAPYRVEFTQAINLVDIPDYRPRGIVVVEHPDDAPWDVRIVTRPDPEWERRAAGAALDSAPASALLTKPATEGSCCLVGVPGLLIGAAVVVLLFRADLFQHQDAAGPQKSPAASAPSSPSAPSSSWSWTSSTGTVSSRTTVAETSDSLLADGELRRTAESVIKAAGTPTAVGFRAEEHRMSVRWAATAGSSDTQPPFDLRSLPYERLPGLVRQARGGLGIDAPTGWRIDVDHDARTKALVLRVTVSDAQGSASLRADAQGRVIGRDPR